MSKQCCRHSRSYSTNTFSLNCKLVLERVTKMNTVEKWLVANRNIDLSRESERGLPEL
jgi:hypothetical protein